jgi:dienelactone hydrolase
MTPSTTPPPLLTLRQDDGETLITTSRRWPVKRADILARFEPILGPLPHNIPFLQPQVLAQDDQDGYVQQKVQYPVETGEQCSAWLLLPKPLAHRQPAILCCHDAVAQGKDEPAGVKGDRTLALGRDLVKRGFVALCPDSVGHGERAEYRGPGSACGKMLWDHQRGLDFLCHLDAVDSDRLGAIGHGFGGMNAVLLGAFDHRVKVLAASGAYEPFAVDADPRRWCRPGPRAYLPALADYFDRGQPPPFEWLELLALVAPRAFHYTYALKDEVFPHAAAVQDDMIDLGRLYDLLGCRDKLTVIETPDGRAYPTAARREAYGVMKQTLQDGRS